MCRARTGSKTESLMPAARTKRTCLWCAEAASVSMRGNNIEKAQSEEVIRGLKDLGVEVFHTHLYKGFGMAAEMAEMQDTVRAAAFAHSLGMKMDTYIQWNTMMYETFFAEEPRAKDWIQRDSLGTSDHAGHTDFSRHSAIGLALRTRSIWIT